MCYCDEHGLDFPCWACERRELQAENARLKERVQELEEELAKQKFITERLLATLQSLKFRLAQAEELLRAKAERLKIPCGNNWIPDPDVAAFLHPEQTEKAETIKYMDAVSAEVEQWPAEKQGLLDSHATGFEREKPCNSWRRNRQGGAQGLWGGFTLI